MCRARMTMVATRPDDRLRAKNSAPPLADRYHVRLELSAPQQEVGGFPTPPDLRRRLRARFRGTGLRKLTRDGGRYG
jgi:hypothetical protein